MSDTNKFETWGIVELMGHTQMAGKISESSIGGTTFIRIDVPDTEGRPGYTRFIGASAIFAIDPTDENFVRMMVKNYIPDPIRIIGLQLPCSCNDNDNFFGDN